MTVGTALAIAPEHVLKQVRLDRSGAGHPRLHVQHINNDHLLSVIRTPPHLTTHSLSALYPTLAEVLAQAREVLRDRQGGYHPFDDIDDSYTFTPRPAHCPGGPDFTDRLSRLDTPALRIAGAELEGAYRGAMGLNLLRTVFPAEYEGLTLEMFEGWWSIFNLFYRLIDRADWFPIHWELLDHLWNGWKECDGNPLHLARYLNEIPVRVFGIGPQEDDDFPVLGILYGLLVDINSLNEYSLRDLGLNISRDEIDPSALRRKLARADLSHLAPPLNHLPEVARVVIGETGNPFLDTCFNFDFLTTSEPFYWDADIPRLRAAWPHAEPVATAYETFLDWFRSDTHDRYWPADFSETGKIRAVVDTIIN